MIDMTEDVVRRGLVELADEAQPADLGDAALATARRRRARRALGVGAVALVAVLALATPYLLLRSGDREPGYAAAGRVVRSGGPLALPGGWTVVGAEQRLDNGRSAVVHDPERGYVEVPFVLALPRPGGGPVAVLQDGTAGLYDLATRRLTRLDVGSRTALDLEWSPDGRRLLVSVGTADTLTGFVVVDPGGTAAEMVPLDRGRYPVVPFDTAHWARDGRSVVVRLARRDRAGRAVGLRWQTFRPDGTPAAALPLTGEVAGWWRWSPDGRAVWTRSCTTGGCLLKLVETASGRTLATLNGELTDVWWVDGNRVLVQNYMVTVAPKPNDVVDTRPLAVVGVDGTVRDVALPESFRLGTLVLGA